MKLGLFLSKGTVQELKIGPKDGLANTEKRRCSAKRSREAEEVRKWPVDIANKKNSILLVEL